uniref:(California timema) hypothetical protein n=1 Tax=Timema californicum TaxID=61474 RepID=A0A7R9IV37_TIMCA|nr:unnamed protein product [Timema californicum]
MMRLRMMMKWFSFLNSCLVGNYLNVLLQKDTQCQNRKLSTTCVKYVKE